MQIVSHELISGITKRNEETSLEREKDRGGDALAAVVGRSVASRETRACLHDGAQVRLSGACGPSEAREGLWV